MNVYDLVLESGINPGRPIGRKREYHCACPGCGGTDRFRIWPEDNNGTGSYNCMGGQGCGRHGDNVQFCIDFFGLDFKAAAQKCGRTDLLDNKTGATPYRRPKPLRSPSQDPVKINHSPNSYQMPNEAWISQANEFVDKCTHDLLGYKKAMAWLAARGINRAAVIKYRLGWNYGDGGKALYKSRLAWGLPLAANENKKNKPLWLPVGLVIPYLLDNQVVRIRIRRPQSERAKNLPKLKYYVVPGSFMGTMVLDPSRRAHVVIEAELDGIATAAAGDQAGAVAVMTLEGKPDAYATEVLNKDLAILNALDFEFDQNGKPTMAGKRANDWWQATYPDTCTRWPVPQGKDPGEAFGHGVDLALWIKAGLPPVFSIKAPVEMAPVIEEAPRQSAAFSTGNGDKATDQRGRGNIPPEVFELRDLLAASGVRLHKREDGRDLGIRKPADYDFGKFHKRLDELVFMNLTVGCYINTLPDGLIGPKGLIG